MLEMFEKLINEHGSSVILKERLELINDKYEALETKLANSEKEKEFLEKENSLLKQELEQLQQQLASQMSNTDTLPEMQQTILQTLFNKSDGIRKEQLANHLQIDVSTLVYHMEALQEQELINYPTPIMGNPLTGTKGTYEYSISKGGRKYVIEVLGA